MNSRKIDAVAGRFINTRLARGIVQSRRIAVVVGHSCFNTSLAGGIVKSWRIAAVLGQCCCIAGRFWF